MTTTCNGWLRLLEQDSCKDIVIRSIIFLNKKYKAEVLAYVIMPNHIHLILFFKDKNELSNWMRDLKKYTAVMIRKELENLGMSNLVEAIRVDGPKKQVFKIWEERFDDLYLESTNILEVKLEYIHLNPLQERWNLVTRPENYHYSSASFYETGQQGILEVVDYRNYF